MPKVSILIPSYNAAHFLPMALESVLSQTYPDFEAIVIDDGSTDNTREVVKGFMAKSPKIKYFFQENQGLPSARNRGIKESTGEYLALLDADDQWLPNRLQEGVKVLDADKTVGLVHANITFMDADNHVISIPQRKVEFLNGNVFDHIFLRNADISCPTVIFRKDCCDAVGLFDTKLTGLGCEDRDLWLRIAQKYPFAYIDRVLANYRVTANSMSRNIQKMIQARLYVVDKYCPEHDTSKAELRQKALSKIYRDLGDDALLKKDFAHARHEYEKAIRYDPLAFWPRINWLKAFLKY